MKSKDNITQARSAYRNLLEQSLKKIVDTLSPLKEVERISLFGSYAQGRADLFTDLDILVVMNTDKGFLERLRMLYSMLVVPVDMDLLCYTPQELERLKERPFFKQMHQEEVVLYEKKGT